MRLIVALLAQLCESSYPSRTRQSELLPDRFLLAGPSIGNPGRGRLQLRLDLQVAPRDDELPMHLEPLTFSYPWSPDSKKDSFPQSFVTILRGVGS